MSATTVALGLANLLLLAALIACCCRRRKYPGQVLSTRLPAAPEAAPAPYPQQQFAPAPYPGPVASSCHVQLAAPYLAGPAAQMPQPCSAPYLAAPYPQPYPVAPYPPVEVPYPGPYAPSAPEPHMPLPPSYEQATGAKHPPYDRAAQ